MKAMPAPVRKAKPAPLRNTSAETWLAPPPPNMDEKTCEGMTVAATAPMIAKLSDCPTNLIVEMVPEAIPKWRLSTEPITELVLGAEKMPIPTPSRKSTAVR